MRRLRLRELLASPPELSAFREVVRGGGVAAIPTETFYALATDPRSAFPGRRVVAPAQWHDVATGLKPVLPHESGGPGRSQRRPRNGFAPFSLLSRHAACDPAP